MKEISYLRHRGEELGFSGGGAAGDYNAFRRKNCMVGRGQRDIVCR